MSALHAEVYEAFRALDVPDEKALRAAVALSSAFARFEVDTVESFDKRDADIEAIRIDVSSINGEIADINTRLAAFQGEVNNRFTSLEAGFDRHLASFQGEVNNRFTSLEAGFDKRLASFQVDSDKRLTSFEAGFDKRLTSVQNDLDRRLVGFQGDVGARLASMQGEINLLKWMMGTTIALLVTVLFRVFTH